MDTISVETLKERLDAGEQLHILDVRENSERAAFNIGGTHIPLGRIQLLDIDAIDNWKEEEVIVYCRSGNRSGMACLMLEQAGFRHIENLTGGMLAWIEKYGDGK